MTRLPGALVRLRDPHLAQLGHLMPTPDILIIGAGIVGAACAAALAGVGLRVHVLDARLPAATAAGMGHLVVMDEDPAELSLSAASLRIWRSWMPNLDAGCAWVDCGTLWLAANDADLHVAQAKARRLQAHGVMCELLDAAQAARAEPALRPGLAGGLRVPGDAAVYAPRVARWLLQQHAGLVGVEAAEVVAIEKDDVLLRDGSRRSAAAMVLAAGVASRHLCPELPLREKKGHLIITDRYPGTVQHQLVELGYGASAHQTSGSSVAFNVQPRPTGQLLIGSSRQFDTEDLAPEPEMLRAVLERALDWLPGLSGLNALRTWTGLRAATPDGLPLIGRHPTRQNLWLALGHEGLGITTAPGTAALLAALIRSAPPPFDGSPFAPARFALAA